MTRLSGELLEKLDPKKERTLSTLRRSKVTVPVNMTKEQGKNIVPRPLKDYATPSLEEATSRIIRPIVDISQFEIKPTTI